MKPKINKLQDDDGHWYWIPENEVENFNNHLKKIEGKYSTGGSPDITPNFFKESQQEDNL